MLPTIIQALPHAARCEQYRKSHSPGLYCYNCGGRCLLIAHVQDGKITRMETDDRPDHLSALHLRACVRGRSYLRRQCHPERLLYPMKRTGRRGNSNFVRISWDETLDTVAGHLQRVKETYGNSALFVPYGTGSYNQVNGSHTARRLMNLFGGCLGFYHDYSSAVMTAVTPYVYGIDLTANQRQSWLNTKYFLLWGWNPAEMRDLQDLRHILEMAAIERAAVKITLEQIKELRSVHARYTGDDDISYDRYTDENRRFHYYLAKASGNNELTQLMGRLPDRLAPFMVMRKGGRHQAETHRRIIDALEANDVDAAREALLDDIERSHESIIDKVLQEEETTWHVG